MLTLDNMKFAYQNNATIARVVDSLYRLIKEGRLSPSEVRAVAMFAVHKYEMEKPFVEHSLTREILNEEKTKP